VALTLAAWFGKVIDARGRRCLAKALRDGDALTLISTCKKLGINPRAYLRDALTKILAGEKDLNAKVRKT
jgi:hypothetical protein